MNKLLLAKPPDNDKRSGMALVMAALSLIVLVPMLGLAIDGSNVYLMRNRINTAMDAAVLAAARSLNVGKTVAQQNAAAIVIAQAEFSADTSAVPNISWPSSGPSAPVFTIADSANHYRTVNGTVTVQLPLTFISLIPGINYATISVATAATRRDVNIVMVLDDGYPMSNVGGGSNVTPLTTLQTDAVAFVNLFANNRDNIGLVTFTSAAAVADALPNQNFLSNVPNDINSLTAAGQGGPNTSAGLEAAYQQLQNLNHQGALNVIVLFTDGIPTGFSGDFGTLLTSSQNTCVATGGHLSGALWLLPIPQSTPLQGNGAGLTDPTIQNGAAQENYDASSVAAPGCPGGISARPASLLTGMPSVDLFNNATIGSYPPAPVTLNGITAQNIVNASENALDAAANRIRSDTSLQPVIFAIGLDGNLTLQPDPILMAKIANDPSSAYYNSSQPTGQSIIAPSTAQLQSAFSSIASQVLRLAAAH